MRVMLEGWEYILDLPVVEPIALGIQFERKC